MASCITVKVLVGTHELHHVERRLGLQPHAGGAALGYGTQRCLFGGRKARDRCEDGRAFVFPIRRCSGSFAGGLVLPAFLEFGLPVLAADPDDVAPAGRIFDEADDVRAAAMAARPADDRAASYGHRELRAGRVPLAGLRVPGPGGVASSRCELVAMVGAPATNRGRVAGAAMPAAAAGGTAATVCAAEADERLRRRWSEVVQVVEGRSAHGPLFGGRRFTVLSHTLTYFEPRRPRHKQLPTMPLGGSYLEIGR
jgi:hypothetical protein